MKTSQVVPFMMLRRFETAEVVELMGEACCVHRLEEIGIRPGVKICMLSPGEPCILALEGKRISLRVECDTDILVEPVGFANAAPSVSGDLVSVEC